MGAWSGAGGSAEVAEGPAVASAALALSAFVEFSVLSLFWRLTGFCDRLGASPGSSRGAAAIAGNGPTAGASRKSEVGFGGFAVAAEVLGGSDFPRWAASGGSG